MDRERDDEVRIQAREALVLYGSSASRVLAEQADALFFQGNIVAAFYQRLIVQAVEELESGTGPG